MKPERLLLSTEAVAKALGLGHRATTELIRTNRIRSIAVGKRRLVPRSELAAWIERELDGHREIL